MAISMKRILSMLLIVAVLLMIPLVGMQITDSIQWGGFDFLVAGGLLLSVMFGLDLVVRKVPKLNHRILLGALVALAFLLLWAELAVGIFGSPIAGS